MFNEASATSYYRYKRLVYKILICVYIITINFQLLSLILNQLLLNWLRKCDFNFMPLGGDVVDFGVARNFCLPTVAYPIAST
jgi:hypothetical protein